LRLLRILLVSFVMTALAALAASCGGSDDSGGSGGNNSGKPFAGQTLRLTYWGGEYEDAMKSTIIPDFEEKTGATIEYTPGWGEQVAKIKSSPPDDPPYDVLAGEMFIFTQAKEAGILQPLDLKKIPNVKHLYPASRETIPYKDGTGVPTFGGWTALAYNENAMPFKPTSWADLLRPEMKGKVSLPRIYWAEDLYVSQLAQGHTDPGAFIKSNPDEAFSNAQTLGDQVKFWYEGGADFVAALKSGQIAAGLYYQELSFTDEWKNAGMKVIVPKEGAIGYTDYWMMVRGTKKQKLAEAFINYVLDPKTQDKYVKVLPAMTYSPDVTQNPDAVASGFYPTNNDQVANFHNSSVDYPWLSSQHLLTPWQERFQKEVIEK
jgi:putative spermidine/putrescine transport system substrate-binding protein